MVFTATQHADGTWADVLSIAQRSPHPVNVIVISRIVDLSLYIQALERGAFDFIVPPLEISELDHVVRCAVGNVLVRRALQPTGGTPSAAASPVSSAAQEEFCPIDDDFQAAVTL